MRYSAYKARMLRIRKVIDFFHRFRFVFIGAAVAITAPLVTLSVIKGNITDVSEFEINYQYGQPISFSGSAFMGEVTFEFRKKGETEWKEDVPKYVGEYEARAKSKGNYGYRYSEVSSFSIDPIEVDIGVKNNNINYGDDHPALEYTLLAGDTLDQDYAVVYDDLSSNTTNVTVDLSTIKIHNQQNVDVTSCYTLKTEPKEISFNKQVINVQFAANQVHQYDGQTYTNDEYTYTGNLCYGAELVVDPGVSVSNIGTYINEHAVRVMKDGVDYSANYDIRVNDNSIRIDRASPIRISTNSLKKSYDGSPFSTEGDVIDTRDGFTETITKGEFTATVEGILPIHHAVIDFTNTEQVNAITGAYNEISYEILDKEGNDVKEIYESISVNKGTMDIDKLKVTLTSDDLTNEYDGTYQSQPNFTATGDFAPGDKAELLTYPKRFEPGTIANTHTYRIIHEVEDGDDIDVSGNYEVTKVSGTITIGKRKITVTTGDVNEQYDNYEKSNDSYTRTSGTMGEGDSEPVVQTTTSRTTPVDNLANTQTYKITHTDPETGETRDVSSYYEITQIKGSISIFTKPLKFIFEERSLEYDGQPHDYYKNDNTATLDPEYASNLPSNFEPIVTIDKSMTDFKEDGYTAVKNDVTVKILDKDHKDSKGNFIDVAQYYQSAGSIEVVLPTSTITKRTATLTYNDYTKTFDNKTLAQTMVLDSTKIDALISTEGLVDGHTLNVNFANQADGNIKDVTDNPVNLSFTYSIKSGTKDVTSNYDVEWTNDKDTIDATIEKRFIEVTTKDVFKVYNADNKFTPELLTDIGGNPIGGTTPESVSIVNTDDYKTADNQVDVYEDYPVDPADIRVYVGGKDVTSNYIVAVQTKGDVHITERPVYISPIYPNSPSHVIYYDAQPHGLFDNGDRTVSNEVYIQSQVTDAGLISGHYVTFDNPRTQTEPGTVAYNTASEPDGKSVFGTKIFDKDGNDVTKNYSITHRSFDYEIIRNALELQANSFARYFDGEKFDVPEFEDLDFDTMYDYTDLEKHSKHKDLFTGTFKTATGDEPLENGLQPGHKFMVSKYTLTEANNRVNPGTTFNYDFEWDIVDENGVSVKHLYDVVVKTGHITVYTSTLTLYCDSSGRKYDALGFDPVSTDPFEVTENSKAEGVYIYKNSTHVGPKFYENFKISAAFRAYSFAELFRVGTYTFTPDVTVLNRDTLDEYTGPGVNEINFGKAKFDYTISAREITITTRTIGAGEMRYISIGQLAGNDVLYFDDEVLDIKNRTWKQTITNENIGIIKVVRKVDDPNVKTININDSSTYIDVTDCYSITIKNL